MHRATLAALAYAKSLAPDRLVALTVAAEAEEAERVQQQWEQYGLDVPLRVLSSPYRELTAPVSPTSTTSTPSTTTTSSP